MKTNFSKIIALVLSVMMLMSTVAFASMDTDDITASYVEFSKDAAGNITARAMLHNDGGLAETAKIIIAAYDGTNVAFAGESEAITIDSKGKASLTATIAFDEDCTYKAFLWTAGNRTPLAEVANANALADLKGIEIDGVALEGFSTSKFTYDYEIDYNNPELPVVKGIPNDNAVYATTSYTMSSDKATATAKISVYNLYDSNTAKRVYTINMTRGPKVLTAEDYDIVDKGTSTMTNSHTIGYDAEGNFIYNQCTTDTVVTNSNKGWSPGKVYNNLQGPEDWYDKNLVGSSWRPDLGANPEYQKFIIYDVDPSIKGSEYFNFYASDYNTSENWDGGLIAFKVKKNCKVSIVATHNIANFPGFTLENTPGAIKCFYNASGDYNIHKIIKEADENDCYVATSDVTFGMIWDMTPLNPNCLTWTQFYDKHFKNSGAQQDSEKLHAYFVGKGYFTEGANEANTKYPASYVNYNYSYTKNYQADEEVVIPGTTAAFYDNPILVVITPVVEETNYNIVDLNGATLSDITTTSYGYASDGTTILSNQVSSADVASEYPSAGRGTLYTNLNGIEDYDKPALRGSMWLYGLPPYYAMRTIFHVDPRFQGGQYFCVNGNEGFDIVLAEEGKNTYKFNVTEPCTVSIIANESGLSFDGFKYENVNDAIMAWQAWYNGPGADAGNYNQIRNIDAYDPYVTPETDVAFGMIWDMAYPNPNRLTWDQYYAKWFEGKTTTSKADLKTAIEAQFAFQNNADGVEDFNEGLKYDGAGYFFDNYDHVYSKTFQAGEVVIPREANGKGMNRPIVVITPIAKTEQQITNHTSSFEAGADKVANDISEKLWYGEMAAR